MPHKKRGLANVPKAKVWQIASKGGKASPTKFTASDARASIAGRKGGRTRANDSDIRSGKTGRKGAKARWKKKGIFGF